MTQRLPSTAQCALFCAEKAGEATAGAEPHEGRGAVATGSSDTPLFPGRASAGAYPGPRSREQVQAAVRSQVAAQRKLARGEFRAMLAVFRGPAAERARAVLRAAEAASVAIEWAYPAAAVAMLLPGDVTGLHDMDGNARMGLRAAEQWLADRAATCPAAVEPAARLSDYLRGARG